MGMQRLKKYRKLQSHDLSRFVTTLFWHFHKSSHKPEKYSLQAISPFTNLSSFCKPEEDCHRTCCGRIREGSSKQHLLIFPQPFPSFGTILFVLGKCFPFIQISNLCCLVKSWHAEYKLFNPFPHTDTFWLPWETSVLKTLWEKEKLLVKRNYSFSQCFLLVWITFLPFSSNFKLSSAKSFNLEESKICRLVMG